MEILSNAHYTTDNPHKCCQKYDPLLVVRKGKIILLASVRPNRDYTITTTRPVRRGRIFLCVYPKSLPLFDSIEVKTLTLDFSRIELLYVAAGATHTPKH